VLALVVYGFRYRKLLFKIKMSATGQKAPAISIHIYSPALMIIFLGYNFTCVRNITFRTIS
jgi:hypothetical protein